MYEPGLLGALAYQRVYFGDGVEDLLVLAVREPGDALGLLIGLMWLLLKLFPASKPKPAAVQAVATEIEDDQQLEELAVALAVGICLLEADEPFPTYYDKRNSFTGL